MKYSSTLYELVVLTFLWIIWQSKVNTCYRNIYYTIHVLVASLQFHELRDDQAKLGVEHFCYVTKFYP